MHCAVSDHFPLAGISEDVALALGGRRKLPFGRALSSRFVFTILSRSSRLVFQDDHRGRMSPTPNRLRRNCRRRTLRAFSESTTLRLSVVAPTSPTAPVVASRPQLAAAASPAHGVARNA